ncbi:MAG: hypothetical protein Q4E69_05395 [Bacilli bacterium]|nr:hypothetical protein [Bacilli bacterium]
MNKKNILIIGLLIVVIVGVFIFGNKGEPTDSEKFKKEYEALNTEKTDSGKSYRELSISKKNPIVYSTAEDIVKRIDNKETFIVYFGFSKCPWCRSILPTMFEVAKDLDIDTIYYVDVLDIRDTKEYKDEEIVTTKEGTSGYNDLLNRLENVLDIYKLVDNEGNQIETDYKRIYAPNIVAIVSGKAESMTTGISDKQDDAYMEITDDMKKEMYNKIKCTMECVSLKATVCEKKDAC